MNNTAGKMIVSRPQLSQIPTVSELPAILPKKKKKLADLDSQGRLLPFRTSTSSSNDCGKRKSWSVPKGMFRKQPKESK